MLIYPVYCLIKSKFKRTNNTVVGDRAFHGRLLITFFNFNGENPRKPFKVYETLLLWFPYVETVFKYSWNKVVTSQK